MDYCTKASPSWASPPVLLLMNHGTPSTLLLTVRYGPSPHSLFSLLGPRPYSTGNELWNTVHTLLLVRYGTSPTLTSLLGTYMYHTDNKYNYHTNHSLGTRPLTLFLSPLCHTSILFLGLTPGSSYSELHGAGIMAIDPFTQKETHLHC